MGSLEKVTTEENRPENGPTTFASDSAQTSPSRTCWSPRSTGLAINLTYENGTFARGTTRGDGVQGEDVTANLRTIKAIHLADARRDPPSVIEVRGEGYFAALRVPRAQ